LAVAGSVCAGRVGLGSAAPGLFAGLTALALLDDVFDSLLLPGRCLGIGPGDPDEVAEAARDAELAARLLGAEADERALAQPGRPAAEAVVDAEPIDQVPLASDDDHALSGAGVREVAQDRVGHRLVPHDLGLVQVLEVARVVVSVRDGAVRRRDRRQAHQDAEQLAVICRLQVELGQSLAARRVELVEALAADHPHNLPGRVEAEQRQPALCRHLEQLAVVGERVAPVPVPARLLQKLLLVELARDVAIQRRLDVPRVHLEADS
jgi:hypothetical protein